jgi:cyclin-dependent kinase 7
MEKGFIELNGYKVDSASVGSGTQAVVFKGVHIATGETVALKRIKKEMYINGFSIDALREIKLMSELSLEPHSNVMRLLEVFEGLDGYIYLVLEFCPTDLFKVINNKDYFFRAGDIKAYMQMLLSGIQHCHERWVLHRDIKPGNILLSSKDGSLKLADFGLGRLYGSPSLLLTDLVVTLWYRPPELVFGSRKYSPAVDIWSLGCIFAELLLRAPIFYANTEIELLRKIFGLLGTPSEETWAGVTALPYYLEFRPQKAYGLGNLLTAADADAIDLISKMLTLNPAARITAKEALEHRYFKSEPHPTPIVDLPTYPGEKKKGSKGR